METEGSGRVMAAGEIGRSAGLLIYFNLMPVFKGLETRKANLVRVFSSFLARFNFIVGRIM